MAGRTPASGVMLVQALRAHTSHATSRVDMASNSVLLGVRPPIELPPQRWPPPGPHNMVAGADAAYM